MEYPSLGSISPSPFPSLFHVHRTGENYGCFLHMVFIANLTSVTKPMNKTKKLHFVRFCYKTTNSLSFFFVCFASSGSKLNELFEISM